MIKYFSYRICQSCFLTMFDSGSFDGSTPLVLIDDLGDEYYSYYLDESVSCDPEVHEENNA